MSPTLASDIQDSIGSKDFARLRNRLIGFTPVEIAAAMLDLKADEQVIAFRVLAS